MALTYKKLIYGGVVEMRLDRWLRRQYGSLPQSAIEKAVRNRFVRGQNAKVKTGYLLQTGDEIDIEIHLHEKWQQDFLNEEAALKKGNLQDQKKKTKKGNWQKKEQNSLNLSPLILIETGDYLVLNKPSGMAVQSGLHIDSCVDDWLMQISERQFRLVHRLDRNTSGLLLIAKTLDASIYFTRQFRERQVKKTYRAVIFGQMTPQHGQIDLPISMVPNEVNKMRIDPEGRKAKTTYKTLFVGDRWSDVELTPETGRKHQLRIHLASQGHPIVGDKKYDPDKKAFYVLKTVEKGVLYLHAQKMQFYDLNHQWQSIECPLPAYWPCQLKSDYGEEIPDPNLPNF